jgi:hypothetical protein
MDIKSDENNLFLKERNTNCNGGVQKSHAPTAVQANYPA